MKRILCTLTCVTCAVVLCAQTPGPATLETHHTPTLIWSDSAEIQYKDKQVVYRGNVHVTDAQMDLKCDVLTAKLPPQGGRVESIVGEGGVQITMLDENNQTNKAWGDLLVYTYSVAGGVTNDVARLTGNSRFSTPQASGTGSAIIWDRITGKIRIEDQQMSVDLESVNSTNSSAIKTNDLGARP